MKMILSWTSLLFKGQQRALFRAYFVCVVSVFLLICTGQIVIQSTLSAQKLDGNVINIAGMQRTRSHMFVKLTLLCTHHSSLLNTPNGNQAFFNKLTTKLRNTVNDFERVQFALHFGNVTMGVPEKHSKEVEKMLADIQPSFERIMRLARTVLEEGGTWDLASRILEYKEDFQPRMDELIDQLIRESAAKIDWFAQLELLIGILSVGLLIIEGVLVFVPVARQLDLQMHVLQEQNQQLYSTNGKLAELRELDTRLIAEREEVRVKNRFLSSMSHEIRTPINGIVGMMALLHATPLTAEQRDCVQTVSVCCDALLGVVNSVLDFAKLGSAQLGVELLEKQTFSLSRIAREAMDMVAPTASKKGLEMVLKCDDTDLPPFVVGDPTRVRQMITNYISNSVKFTSKGSIVVYVQNAETKAAARLRRGAVFGEGRDKAPRVLCRNSKLVGKLQQQQQQEKKRQEGQQQRQEQQRGVEVEKKNDEEEKKQKSAAAAAPTGVINRSDSTTSAESSTLEDSIVATRVTFGNFQGNNNSNNSLHRKAMSNNNGGSSSSNGNGNNNNNGSNWATMLFRSLTFGTSKKDSSSPSSSSSSSNNNKSDEKKSTPNTLGFNHNNNSSSSHLSSLSVGAMSSDFGTTEEEEDYDGISEEEDLEQSLVAQVTIRDTGIGIAEEDLRKLFREFSQVDVAHNRRYGGTGLGLAIVKRLAQLMKGDVFVSSTPNKGSSFGFVVQLGKVQPEEASFLMEERPSPVGGQQQQQQQSQQHLVIHHAGEENHNRILPNHPPPPPLVTSVSSSSSSSSSNNHSSTTGEVVPESIFLANSEIISREGGGSEGDEEEDGGRRKNNGSKGRLHRIPSPISSSLDGNNSSSGKSGESSSGGSGSKGEERAREIQRQPHHQSSSSKLGRRSEACSNEASSSAVEKPRQIHHYRHHRHQRSSSSSSSTSSLERRTSNGESESGSKIRSSGNNNNGNKSSNGGGGGGGGGGAGAASTSSTNNDTTPKPLSSSATAAPGFTHVLAIGADLHNIVSSMRLQCEIFLLKCSNGILSQASQTQILSLRSSLTSSCRLLVIASMRAEYGVTETSLMQIMQTLYGPTSTLSPSPPVQRNAFSVNNGTASSGNNIAASVPTAMTVSSPVIWRQRLVVPILLVREYIADPNERTKETQRVFSIIQQFPQVVSLSVGTKDYFTTINSNSPSAPSSTSAIIASEAAKIAMESAIVQLLSNAKKQQQLLQQQQQQQQPQQQQSSSDDPRSFIFFGGSSGSTPSSTTGAKNLTSQAPLEVIATTHPLKILLADDNDINRRIAKKLLERLGYSDVHAVEDGKEALDAVLAADPPYDVVLMDMEMPVMDGLESSREIVAQVTPAAIRPTIIAISANVTSEAERVTQEAGMSLFVGKPYTPHELRCALLASPQLSRWSQSGHDSANSSGDDDDNENRLEKIVANCMSSLGNSSPPNHGNGSSNGGSSNNHHGERKEQGGHHHLSQEITLKSPMPCLQEKDPQVKQHPEQQAATAAAGGGEDCSSSRSSSRSSSISSSSVSNSSFSTGTSASRGGRKKRNNNSNNNYNKSSGNQQHAVRISVSGRNNNNNRRSTQRDPQDPTPPPTPPTSRFADHPPNSSEEFPKKPTLET